MGKRGALEPEKYPGNILGQVQEPLRWNVHHLIDTESLCESQITFPFKEKITSKVDGQCL